MNCQWCGRTLIRVDNPMRLELCHRRGEEALCPGPPTDDTVTSPNVPDQPHALDRRAQQIAAVRDILGWDAESVDDYGNAIDPLAARIVDAVEAVPPPLAIALRNDLEIMRAELAEAHAEHHQACIDRDERLTLEESSTLAKMVDDLRAQLDLAHAAGYAAAVAALRDDQAHERWGDTNGRAIWGSPIRDNLADYLEAVGPGTQPADPQPADEEWTLAQVMDGARGREAG